MKIIESIKNKIIKKETSNKKIPKKMRYYTLLENGWRIETDKPWSEVKIKK